jgi:copper chaperone CopZ
MIDKFKNSIALVLAVTVFSLISTSSFAQENTNKTFIQIRVDGLSCPFCAYGLEKKLKKVDGAKNLFIQLEEGLVSLNVPASKKPSEEVIKKIVTDAGFTPREIKFSDAPFKSDAPIKKEGDDQ